MTGQSAPIVKIDASGTIGQVREMYQAYPYPSPAIGDTLIDDVANSLYTMFGETAFHGMRILDAGCGTGHRLCAIARNYPNAHLIGLDMTPASLDVARALAKKHGLENVEFRMGDLVSFAPQERFDLVISAGVIHHLEDPCRGVRNLASLLTDEGILAVWHYHALGEHQRLLDREMVQTLWDRDRGFDSGLQLLDDLGLRLATRRYGSSAAQSDTEISQTSIDVDAYLHPIVNAYRFDEAIRMFGDCGELDWTAINNVNLPNASKLLDLGEVEQADLRYFCLTVEDLFDAKRVRERFRQLPLRDQLRVIELRTQPTGFTIVGGRGYSYSTLRPRVQSNVVTT